MQVTLSFKSNLEEMIHKIINKLPGNGSLSQKLIAVIITVNGIGSLFVTATTVIVDYKFETSRIMETVKLIQSSNLGSISLGVWNYDESLIRLQAEGMLHYKYLKRVRVREPKGLERSYGMSDVADPMIFTLSLPSASKNFSNDIGTLEISFASRDLYLDLFKKFSVVLITQFLKALAVSLILFYIFNIILIRPILQASQKLLSFSPENFVYNPIPIMDQGNELDELFKIINSLAEKNIYTHHQLSKINEDLEFIISERTAIIQKQEKALADEARLASIGRVAGGIAHEINTPLSAAVIKLSLLKNKALTEVNSIPMADSIEKISNILGRITVIINNMKALNRDASQEEIEDTSLADVIGLALNMCDEVTKHKNIKVHFERAEFEDIWVKARPVQLGQILVNLVRNSVDAIEMLEEKWIRIEAKAEDKKVRIIFCDSGKGLAVDLANKIFDPYFTTKDQGKGSGLGLSLSRKMINAMDGNMYLDVNAAHTTFIVELKKKTSS